jgi:hypothetical protein
MLISILFTHQVGVPIMSATTLKVSELSIIEKDGMWFIRAKQGRRYLTHGHRFIDSDHALLTMRKIIKADWTINTQHWVKG